MLRRRSFLAVLIAAGSAFALWGGTLRALSAPAWSDASDAGARAAVQAALDTRAGEAWQAGAVERRGDWALVAAVAADEHDPLTALARWDGRTWQAALPGSAAFVDWLRAMPVDAIDGTHRNYLLSGVQPSTAVFTQGYRLPWIAGLNGYVTQGSNAGNSHLNQVDFDLQGLAASGLVVAAKGGTVVFAKESSDSGCVSISCWSMANMVVIQHAPNEFSWYVHLAFQSVPVSAGSLVSHGTVIGVEGRTGFASGVHLHYMVSTARPASWPDPNNPNAAPWPPSGTIVEHDWCEADMAEIWPPDVLPSGNVLELEPGLTLHRDARCQGPAESFAQDDPNLLDNLIITQTASSLGLSSEWAVRLYPLAGYQGSYTQLALETHDLSQVAIGDNGARGLRLARTCQYCPGFNDSYEPDDTALSARVLTQSLTALGHTMWITSDLDWARFDALGGTHYLLYTSRLGPHSDTVLALFDTDGTTLLAEDDDGAGGRASLIRWTAPGTGAYFLRVRPFDWDVTGIDSDYDLVVMDVQAQVFLPTLIWSGP